MRTLLQALAVTSLVACATPQSTADPYAAPTPTTSAPCAPCEASQVVPMQIDEEMLVEKSKALLDAIDSNDVATFQRMVGPSFELFEDARGFTTTMIVQQMASRLERSVRRSRQWREVRTQIGPNVGVFTGLAVEQVPTEGGRKTDWEGWNTVVWAFDGAAWKAVHAQWQPGGIEAERMMWNEAFRKAISFKQTPNQLLVDTVKAAKPKRGLAALDIAMGQGRNTIFLAQQGYTVTGIDISDEGIRLARETAAKAKVKLTALQTNVDTYEMGVGAWDLVTLLYAGSDTHLVDKIKIALKPGGTVIVEYFHADAANITGVSGFTTGQLAGMFKGWTIVKDEVVEDVADWGMRKTKLVRFVARKP